jgi:hypothetical protein
MAEDNLEPKMNGGDQDHDIAPKPTVTRRKYYRSTPNRKQFYYSDLEADKRLEKARDSLTGIGDTAYKHFKDVLESLTDKHTIEVRLVLAML